MRPELKVVASSPGGGTTASSLPNLHLVTAADQVSVLAPRLAAARCRCCGGDDLSVFLSLGDLPLSDGFITEAELVKEDPRYPLDVAFCGELHARADTGDRAARSAVLRGLPLLLVVHRMRC